VVLLKTEHGQKNPSAPSPDVEVLSPSSFRFIKQIGAEDFIQSSRVTKFNEIQIYE